MLPSSVSPEIFDSVITLQNETLFYIEISIKFVQVQTDMKNLLAALSRKNIQVSMISNICYLTYVNYVRMKAKKNKNESLFITNQKYDTFIPLMHFNLLYKKACFLIVCH